MTRASIVVSCALALGCGKSRTIDASYEVVIPACHASGTAITFRQIAVTQGGAILVTAPPSDTRQFVVEQEGRIRILDLGVYQPSAQSFLDISGDNNGPVLICGEQGLLGLAFHPQYATNRQFYVSYTTANSAWLGRSGDHLHVDVIARYTAKADDPSHGDPAAASSSCPSPTTP